MLLAFWTELSGKETTMLKSPSSASGNPSLEEPVTMRIIAHIESDFKEKFGIPRQSGLVDSLKARIVFQPEYRDPLAFRGLESYSHIWILWQFSKAAGAPWSPTVRPPRLGGNTRMGVFATRSPFRPNSIGLSAVGLERVELQSPPGPILHVTGADLLDGTPIFDIKPYLPYTDAYPQASPGFSLPRDQGKVQVVIPPQWLERIPQALQRPLEEVLAEDPRPGYQHDPQRVYKMAFGGLQVHFTVDGETLTVCRVEESL